MGCLDRLVEGEAIPA